MKAVFRSGDEEGTGVRCYDCGEKFSDALTGNEKIGDFVTCAHCGGRGAYITEVLVKEIPCGEGDLPCTFGEHLDGGKCRTEYYLGKKGIFTNKHGKIRIVRSNGRTCQALEIVNV